MEKFDKWNKVKKHTEANKRKLGIRAYSLKRLMNKTGVVNKEDFELIIEKSKKLFD